MSRAQLTSTVEQNSAGAAAPQVAGKNLIINGGFDIWQRGTSSSASAGYSADRWYTQGVGGATTSQQTSGAPNGSQYFLRSTSTANSGGANYYQFMETVNVSQMWGKTVTFTVLLRRNASMSSSLNVSLYKSATVDAGIAQHPATAIASVSVANATLPTGTGSSNWYTASITANVPNDGTANSIYVVVSLNANIPTGAYFDIAQAQLEIGSVATPFSRAGGTLQGELALCQRYYTRFTSSSGSTFNPFALGVATGTTTATTYYNLPVQMRVAPTALDYSTLCLYDGGAGTFYSFTSAVLNQTGPQTGWLYVSGASGMTQYRPIYLTTQNSSSGYLGFSAEL